VKDEALFEDGYLQILERCDVLVLCTDDYKNSVGTNLEIRRALEQRIPVITKELFNVWLSVRNKEKEMLSPTRR